MAELMTVTEVAKRLNASSSLVYSLLSSGELRHYRIGRAGIRVSEQQILDYLSSKEQGNQKSAPRPTTPLKHLQR